jgi:NADH dehydrogenase
VGILAETGKNTFDAVQADGAERVARIASEAGVAKLVQLSAIGADTESESEYSRTKGEGEAAVVAAFPDAVILRPSIIFGTEDGFFNRFAGMTRFGPVLPVVGADTQFQPVWVDDVAQAAVASITKDVDAGVYELGGPDVYTFREMMQVMLTVIKRRRLILNIPFGIANIIAPIAGAVQFLSLGIVKAPITKDQVINLRKDNVVGADSAGFAAFGIEPTNLEAVLPDYLWRFRPSGQYDAIKDSAKNLKKA